MTDGDSQLRRRRDALTTQRNPNPDRDRVSTLTAELTIPGSDGSGTVAIDLRYVADRDIFAPTVFSDYLEIVATQSWQDLETLADAILDDVNNQAVPRWLWLRLATPRHAVIQQDRQPRWDNQELLATLDFS
ncbi:MAG: hypothetical protein QF578_13595 [Alphaproteobacteria bacterium]|jgi:hypothetical protein|nr:hypothetical protein [Alphaproteobacteria bacterium]MDP6814033.1 hypothetical protein [Alphaproteobacteria bacterium]